jgi:hypothetical protein
MASIAAPGAMSKLAREILSGPAAASRSTITTLADTATGAENWATIASLIETCRLNAVDPLAYLTDTLTTIVNGHKQSEIEGLLPWNYVMT